MKVKSRVQRILKNLNSFSEVNDEFSIEDLELNQGEICYGLYENIPKQKNERIAVTNKGMYLYEESAWTFICFSEISEVNFLDENEVNIKESKMKTEHLTLEMVNGELIKLPVRGRDGRFKDIFGFMRFLMRVLWDTKRKMVKN